MWNKFNPTLKKFLDDKKDITLIGIYWSLCWRWTLVFCVAYMLLIMFLGFFGIALEGLDVY